MSSWFGNDSNQAQAYDQFTSAARAYEKHVAANGQPSSHAEAKEILAGLAGAFVDREVETRGLDFVDKEKDRVLVQLVARLTRPGICI